MSKKQIYDVTYVTVDSISEGVGSSQILPLLQRLSTAGLSVNLISFEKVEPSIQTQQAISAAGVECRRAGRPDQLLRRGQISSGDRDGLLYGGLRHDFYINAVHETIYRRRQRSEAVT